MKVRIPRLSRPNDFTNKEWGVPDEIVNLALDEALSNRNGIPLVIDEIKNKSEWGSVPIENTIGKVTEYSTDYITAEVYPSFAYLVSLLVKEKQLKAAIHGIGNRNDLRNTFKVTSISLAEF